MSGSLSQPGEPVTEVFSKHTQTKTLFGLQPEVHLLGFLNYTSGWGPHSMLGARAGSRSGAPRWQVPPRGPGHPALATGGPQNAGDGVATAMKPREVFSGPSKPSRSPPGPPSAQLHSDSDFRLDFRLKFGLELRLKGRAGGPSERRLREEKEGEEGGRWPCRASRRSPCSPRASCTGS